jgi:hypothetical protein
MGKRQVKQNKRDYKPMPMTAEEAEDEMISLATKVAREQLRAGTASPSVIVHYLKLGSSRERLEQENKELENELLIAKRENLEQSKRIESLYADAIAAFKDYNGEM